MVERFEEYGRSFPVVPSDHGRFVRYSDYAALKAENERLERERDKWEQRACTGDDVLARTRDKLSAAERAGGVNVGRRALNLAIIKWATDSDIDITLGDAEALHLAILSALTTEPAAPEGQQEAASADEFAERFFAKMEPPLTEREKTIAAMAIGYALTRPSEQVVTEDDVAARLWKAEAEDVGAPASIANNRTRTAFDEQSDDIKARWRKFAKAAMEVRDA